MKKKQIVILTVVAVFLALLGLGIWLSKDARTQGNKNMTGDSITKEEKGDVEDGLETEGESNPKSEMEPGKNTSEQKQTSNIREWLEEKPAPDSKFPYHIPNTSLVVRAVKSYNGVFIEDGSERDVTGISAIIVDNVGEECVEYAKITLECNGKDLVYKVSTLEPKGTMVVWESSASPYSDGEYGQCVAQVANMNDLEMSEDKVKVTETESGSLQVENISGKDIPCVRIFYKFYMEDLGVCVGGITYTSKIVQLKAGESRNVTPTHYDSEASRVMMVRTYEEY
jgi:hypothetical protein